MADKIVVKVELEVDAEDWALAYGLLPREVADDVAHVLRYYKVEVEHFGGATDAPFKVRSVGKARRVKE